MFNQMFTEKSEGSDDFCTIVCTELTHPCPNMMISPAERDSILLITHVPQNAILTRDQFFCWWQLAVAFGTMLWEFFDRTVANERDPKANRPHRDR
jgi:hypothetical protein